MERDVKDLFRRSAVLVELIRWVLDEQSVRRSVAVGALEELHRHDVEIALGAMDVDRLREVTDEVLRLAPLRDAGLVTVLDVATASVAELDALPEVGVLSATKLHEAAQQLARAVGQEVAIRFDPDHRSARATSALRHVQQYGELQRVVKPITAAAATTHTVLDVYRTNAKPARQTVRFLFARADKRRRVNSALDLLAGLLDAPDTIALHQKLRSIADTLGQPERGTDEIWREFERDAATVIATIEDLRGPRVGRPVAGSFDPVHGLLPSDIVAAIDALELDQRHLRVTLRAYQSFGARYAVARGRAILGDEMGLGKTVQALAAMAHLYAAGDTHFVVVCPATVLVNWYQEVVRHSDLPVARVHGTDRDAELAKWVTNGGVLVTTFETLRSIDVAAEVTPAMVVVDEAHYIKNRDALRTQAAVALLQRSPRALFLTGTPMENRLTEFIVLADHLAPGIESSLDRAAAAAGADAFRRSVASLYLRRNQVDVLSELPDRIDEDEWVEMTPADLSHYKSAVTRRHFMDMRRAAFVERDIERGAKSARLAEILADAADDGRKVVVFSAFLDVLDAAVSLAAPHGFGPLTGALSPMDRQQLVDDFTAHDGYAVLISQIQAGGIGLNLQAASVVVLCEPQWKSTTEDQAIGRCHRMGQTRPVHVFRLLAEGTVDEHLRDAAARKRVLFDDYARESDLKDHAAGATEVSESESIGRLIAIERARFDLVEP